MPSGTWDATRGTRGAIGGPCGAIRGPWVPSARSIGGTWLLFFPEAVWSGWTGRQSVWVLTWSRGWTGGITRPNRAGWPHFRGGGALGTGMAFVPLASARAGAACRCRAAGRWWPGGPSPSSRATGKAALPVWGGCNLTRRAPLPPEHAGVAETTLLTPFSSSPLGCKPRAHKRSCVCE